MILHLDNMLKSCAVTLQFKDYSHVFKNGLLICMICSKTLNNSENDWRCNDSAVALFQTFSLGELSKTVSKMYIT